MIEFMDPDIVRQLITGHPDIITPEVKAEEARYKHLRCPVCGKSGCEKRIRVPKPGDGLDVGAILFDGNAYCKTCGTLFDPYTQVVQSSEASLISPAQE
jgi:hypothetical protein